MLRGVGAAGVGVGRGSGDPSWEPASWSSLQYAWHRGRSLASPTLELFHHQKPGDRSRQRRKRGRADGSELREARGAPREPEEPLCDPGTARPAVLPAVSRTASSPVWPLASVSQSLTLASQADSSSDPSPPSDWPPHALATAQQSIPRGQGAEVQRAGRGARGTPHHTAVPGALVEGGGRAGPQIPGSKPQGAWGIKSQGSRT